MFFKRKKPTPVHPDGSWVNGSSGSTSKLSAWAAVIRRGRRQFALNPASGEAGPTSRARCATYPLWSKKILTAVAQRVFTQRTSLEKRVGPPTHFSRARQLAWKSPGVAAVLGPKAWAKTLSMWYTDPCQFNVVARHLSEVPSCCPRGPLHWQTAKPDNTQIHFTDKQPKPDSIQYTQMQFSDKRGSQAGVEVQQLGWVLLSTALC